MEVTGAGAAVAVLAAGTRLKLTAGSVSGVSGGGAAGVKLSLLSPPDMRLNDRARASAAFFSLLCKI